MSDETDDDGEEGYATESEGGHSLWFGLFQYCPSCGVMGGYQYRYLKDNGGYVGNQYACTGCGYTFTTELKLETCRDDR